MSEKNICKTLEQVAESNEVDAVELMLAVERIGDEQLKQQLSNMIHRMNLDATQLRRAREGILQND